MEVRLELLVGQAPYRIHSSVALKVFDCFRLNVIKYLAHQVN